MRFLFSVHLSLWLIVPHGCYPDLPRARKFGIRLTTLGHDGLLMLARIPHSTEKACLEPTFVTGSARQSRQFYQ